MTGVRHIRILLALIAVALFLNALNPWLRPSPVAAQQPPADLPMMEVHLRNIDDSMDRFANDVRDLSEASRRMAASLEETSDDVGQLLAVTQRQQNETCVWTVIREGETSIGQDGAVSLSPAWSTVSRAGWKLRAIHGDDFVFEQCR